jgi:hypothetical protein
MHDDLVRPAHHLRLGPLAVLFLTGLLALAACSAGVPPTPGPSGAPTASTGGSPSESAGPSGSTGELLDHPTGADEVILRIFQGGGFVPIGFMATEMPAFTLYGDGTVIFRPSGSFPPVGGSGAYPPLAKATMTPQQVDQLLRFALEQGGLADAKARYEVMNVADAPTTIFTIDAAGVQKTVNVYALGMDTGSGPDSADKAKFVRLAEVLNGFEREVERGNATAAGDYEPQAWRAILIEADGSEGERRDWPWSDLEPADFTQQPGLPSRSAVITPEQARALVDDPGGGVVGVLVTGPDKAPYTIALRPLLPDEKA